MKRIVTVFAVACVACAACAEEAEEKAEGSQEESAEALPAAKPAQAKPPFTTLPLCRLVEGVVDVCQPKGEWVPAEEGRFYPLGTSYRAGLGGRLVLAFGPEATATIREGSAFGTRAQAIGVVSRTLVLMQGTVSLKLPENLPEGMFFVAAPGFQVKNPAGESRYDYVDVGDGDKVTVRCVTGSLAVEGRHFDIPAMRSANEVVLRTSRDHLATFLYGTSGDYVVKLDQGLRTREEFGDDGQMKRIVEKGTNEWHLTPATKVLISRAVPSIGSRMSVHTIAFDAAGERKSECYFCEGRAEINSGELVAKEKLDSEEVAKRAAEATETTAATDVDEPAEGASSDGGGDSSSDGAAATSSNE